MLQMRSSSRPRSLARDREELTGLPFAFAEQSSRSQRCVFTRFRTNPEGPFRDWVLVWVAVNCCYVVPPILFFAVARRCSRSRRSIAQTFAIARFLSRSRRVKNLTCRDREGPVAIAELMLCCASRSRAKWAAVAMSNLLTKTVTLIPKHVFDLYFTIFDLWGRFLAKWKDDFCVKLVGNDF